VVIFCETFWFRDGSHGFPSVILPRPSDEGLARQGYEPDTIWFGYGLGGEMSSLPARPTFLRNQFFQVQLADERRFLAPVPGGRGKSAAVWYSKP